MAPLSRQEGSEASRFVSINDADKPCGKSLESTPETEKMESTLNDGETASPSLFGFPLEFGKKNQARKSSLHKKRSGETQACVAQTQEAVSSMLRGAIREQRTDNGNSVGQNDSKDVIKPTEGDTATKGEKIGAANSVAHSEQYDSDLEPAEFFGNDNALPPSLFVPKKSVVVFEGHLRATTALAVNPKASRLASGGHDAEVRLWDFNGMTSEANSFRRFSPISNHSIRALSYSPSGSHFICAAGDAICRVYDVDGNKLQETVKGDMYVRDLSQTKGHTHGLTDCAWHPFDREKFMTASSDATVRIFDLNAKPYGVDQALPHLHILKAVDKRNLNIAGQCRVTAASWAPSSAKFLVAGCSDGSLQLWNERKAYGKPDKIVRDAHKQATEVSGVAVFRDECKAVSRGMDGTMKLWDLRMFKTPLHSWSDLPNDVVGLGVCLNPDEKLIATGTSSSSTQAAVKIFNCTSFELLPQIDITASTTTTVHRGKGFGIAKILWPDELNQLILGCTDGTIRMFYDTVYSKKGALLFAERLGPSRRAALEGYQAPIFTLDALPPGYKETRFGKIRKVKPREKDDAADRHFNRSRFAPTAPASFLSGKTAGKAPEVAPLPLMTKEDPVESIRAYAAKAAAEPIFVTQAYSKAQPKTILDYSMDDGDDEKLVSGGNRCPRCGLKLCQCGYMTLSNAIKATPGAKHQRTS